MGTSRERPHGVLIARPAPRAPRPRCAGRAPLADPSPGSQPPTPAALHRRPHRGVRPAFPSGFSPAARGLRDKGALGPAAANRRQRARPARLRAAASTEARVRRAEGAGKAKLALKGGRRTRPGAAAPRSFSRISGPHHRDDHFTSAADNGGRSPGIDPNAPPGLLGLVVPRGALPACAEAPPGVASQVPRT